MTLDLAVRSGNLAMVNDLLRNGVDVDKRGPEGFTPLMVASGHGHFHIAEILLTAGADVHALEPRMGASALHKAVQSGNPDLVDLLLSHGAFIDQQSASLGNSPLIDAVLYKHVEVVEGLLSRGARTHTVNYWGQTALDTARQDGLDEIARLLEDHNRRKAEHVESLTLIKAVRAGHGDAVAAQISANADINQTVPVSGSVDDKYTPLGIAAREGHTEIVRLLLRAGARPERLIGLMGGMALHDATYFGHADIVRLLASATKDRACAPGLNVQGAYNGFTALHDAVWHGYIEVARALIEAGARTDLRSHSGMTPRDLAVLYGYPEIVELLDRASLESKDEGIVLGSTEEEAS